MGRALAVIIWILTLLSVSLFFVNKWWFPTAISSHAAALDRQFIITIIVVGIAFTAAQVGLGFMVWRYREDATRSRAVYTHGSSRLEVIWTIVTAIIFIGAQQFQWNFHYAGADGVFGRTEPTLIDDSALNFIGLDDTDPKAKDDSVHSVLAVPAGHPVELLLRSKDVIHNFWVPQLRFNQDLVPGMVIRVHFTANTPGKYELACAELCGQLHFKMKSYMLVLPEDEHRALISLPQDQFQTRMTELLAKYQLPTQVY